jgi:hypothetical protein
MMMQTLFSSLIVLMLISGERSLSCIETDNTSWHFCDKDITTINFYSDTGQCVVLLIPFCLPYAMQELDLLKNDIIKMMKLILAKSNRSTNMNHSGFAIYIWQ